MTKYDFTDSPQPTDPVELLATPHRLLIEAGRALKVLSLQTGSLHPTLQQMAQEHAQTQADQNRIGHQGWSQRSQWLFSAIPEGVGFREVAALSGHESAPENIFQTWRGSPAHWPWVNGRCDYWGYGMAVSEAGIWYACGIFADRRT